MRKPRILIISQVYVPDPASVGQHMADAAEELARRGYDVRVLTSARGYSDPTVKYPRRERRGGVDVVRLPFSSFGKRTIALRLLGQAAFLVQAIIRGCLTPRLSKLLISTSPPMCSIAALAIRAVRRVPIKYWVMDINPDQTIALGKIPARGWAARCFHWLNRRILRQAEDVIVLDRFMAERINAKLDVRSKMTVLPPWPHEDELETVPRSKNPFIREHALADKFVVMYSGNHALTSPLETLVDAALRLQDHPRLFFMFIGGGLGKQYVEDAIAAYQPPNIVALPYLPLDQIKYSLSAADVHVASLSDALVGIVHPCKIYGAMAVGKPILWLGPSPSHASEIVEAHEIGWRIEHGDTDGAVELLKQIASADPGDLAQLGRRARQVLQQTYSKHRLCSAFCNVIERDRNYGFVPAASGAAGRTRAVHRAARHDENDNGWNGGSTEWSQAESAADAVSGAAASPAPVPTLQNGAKQTAVQSAVLLIPRTDETRPADEPRSSRAKPPSERRPPK